MRCGAPNIVIHDTNKPFIMVLGSLLGITRAWQNLVAISTITRKCELLNFFKSIPINSLNLDAKGRHTEGLGVGLLYFKHVIQASDTELISLHNFLFLIPAFLIKFNNVFALGWPNC